MQAANRCYIATANNEGLLVIETPPQQNEKHTQREIMSDSSDPQM